LQPVIQTDKVGPKSHLEISPDTTAPNCYNTQPQRPSCTHGVAVCETPDCKE